MTSLTLTAGDVVYIKWPNGESHEFPIVIENGEPCILDKGRAGHSLMHEGKVYKIAEWPFGITILEKAHSW